MSLPTNLNNIDVVNQTQHRQSPDTESPSTDGDPPPPSTENNSRRDRKNAGIRAGFIVKHHIFPKHKFIKNSDDLRFDDSEDGKTICATYIDALMTRDKPEAHNRKLWETARYFIPTALNTQRNNTTKAIRDITFKSKSSVEMHVSFDTSTTYNSLLTLIFEQSCLEYSRKISNKTRSLRRDH